MDEWSPPDGWRETGRGRWLHTSGARCLFVVDQRDAAGAQSFAWVAVTAGGEPVGAFTRVDGWLDAAMARAAAP